MRTIFDTPHARALLDDRENCHQPEVSVWIDRGDDGTPRVIMMLGDKMGQQKRFVEMTFADARTLASILYDKAAIITLFFTTQECELQSEELRS